MSDDPKSKDGGWQPPEPVFRSTEGRTPRTAKDYLDPDDIDTAAPGFAEVDTPPLPPHSEASAGGGSDTTSIPKPASRSNAPRTESASESRGCFSTVLTMLGIATILVVVVIAVALYFLLFYTPASNTF